MSVELLKAPVGSKKNRKRIGRGPGSGTGKTAGKGNKGQNARKSGGTSVGFEGGQTPLYRRLPKRGFKNSKFKKLFSEINVSILNKFENDQVIGVKLFKKMGMLNSKFQKVKILGDGKLEKKLEVHAHKFSNSAKEKIEKAGGKIIIIE
jgi:large subunit ribosomal protein L15